MAGRATDKEKTRNKMQKEKKEGTGRVKKNYVAISAPTIRGKRNYGINGGVRRGVIKNVT